LSSGSKYLSRPFITDASYSVATASGASGVVLRNSQGKVLAAVARVYTNIADVTMAEALAARDGVLLATEQGATKVILEVDNLRWRASFVQRKGSAVLSPEFGMKSESLVVCLLLLMFLSLSLSIPRGYDLTLHRGNEAGICMFGLYIVCIRTYGKAKVVPRQKPAEKIRSSRL
jgi:hypothetical protein